MGVHIYVYVRNSFTKKEDETEYEEQHNYDHGHDNDHDEQDEEEDDQMGDLYIMRVGNLDVNSDICIIEIARFAITYAYVCFKDSKPIPLHFMAYIWSVYNRCLLFHFVC